MTNIDVRIEEKAKKTNDRFNNNIVMGQAHSIFDFMHKTHKLFHYKKPWMVTMDQKEMYFQLAKKTLIHIFEEKKLGNHDFNIFGTKGKFEISARTDAPKMVCYYLGLALSKTYSFKEEERRKKEVFTMIKTENDYFEKKHMKADLLLWISKQQEQVYLRDVQNYLYKKYFNITYDEYANGRLAQD